jgi:hypothetical protein
MLGAMRNWLWPLVAALVLSLVAADEADAKKRRCRKNQRRVVAGTPVFGGPGLGFDTTAIWAKTQCTRVLRSTEDGAFAMVRVDKERVGWVATGLVDAALSEDKNAKAESLDESREVVALRDMPLRKRPRFDASAGATIKQGTKLKVTGRSPDGLWLYTEGEPGKGWLSRYQVADAMPEAGSAPTAGSGEWTVAEPEPLETPPPVPVKVKGGDETKTAEGETPGEGEGEVSSPAPPVVGPPSEWLGRGHTVETGLSFGQWTQRYSSDAQNDPYYKYELQSFGGGGGLGYTWRPDFPLVLQTRAQFEMYGFEIVPPGTAEPAYVPVFNIDAYFAAAWRLYGTADVDVEAGLGAGLSGVLIGDLLAGNQLVEVFTPALYLNILRPHVAAHSRVGGGSWGLVSLEAAVPVGAYLMVYNPAQKYADGSPADGYVLPVEGRPARLDEEPPEDAGEAEPTMAHMALGVEARMSWAYPVTDMIRLRASCGFAARQAFIEGPGVRVLQPYLHATNIDVSGGLQLGVDFGL